MPEQPTLASNHKRQMVVRTSMTRLDTRVAEFEAKGEALSAGDARVVQQLLQRLSSFDSAFKAYHLVVIDVIEPEALETEQGMLNEHDDKVAVLTVRLQQLTSKVTVVSMPDDEPSPSQLQYKRLDYLDRDLQAVVSSVDSAASGTEVDSCLCEEQLSALRSQLVSVSCDIITHGGDHEASLFERLSELNRNLFDLCLWIKHLHMCETGPSTTPVDDDGVKLPKVAVPAFDGNIINWHIFWEQFSISVDGRSRLYDAKKLTYLQVALKYGNARNLIEGLFGSGSQYCEAINCLRKRFDRPCLLHQANVRAIVDAPPLKDGSGKELRRLHDVVVQYVCALKAMDHEPSGPFVTSLLELKLDADSMFEFERQGQGQGQYQGQGFLGLLERRLWLCFLLPHQL